MCSYLKNRKHKVQTSNNFNTAKTIINGVLQGSTYRPHLFDLFINDLVLFPTETVK